MKKMVLACFVLFTIALAGIGGWLLKSTLASRAQANQYVAWAQEQKIVPIDFAIAVPPETPADQTVYLSGSASALGAWDAAGVPMQRGADGKYHASVPLLSGISQEFKVTRGTWGTVERGAGGVESSNHAFVAEAGKVVEASVLSWVDNGKTDPGKVTLTGEFRVHKKFQSKLLGNERTIIVCLPPGYDSAADLKYPVLYMQDGQNLFDASTSYNGIEWQVDETAQNLITNKKIEPVIIVGIYNSPERTPEFTPFNKTPTGEAGRGNLYGRFIVEELKPMIDHAYRTLPDRAHTAIAGSAMGGLVTLAIAHDHADVFGNVAVLDPWLRDSQHALLDEWKDDSWMKQTRFYIDMGTNGAGLYPTDSAVDDANKFDQKLKAAGLKAGTDYSFQIVQGAQHGESAWQKRIGNVLMFLYGQK
jgi:predicted alpha/beta superfamily hydrolase